ncbi:MAG: HAMP domain-containing histidine kinase [Pseudomonadota bacterium]|nr:HAMP domain-containing histidine kinase [Pseudomonadota bacterium]MDQ2704796.1 HAMP domain-containing histidine kinase [Pseudomonadota bacterium]
MNEKASNEAAGIREEAPSRTVPLARGLSVKLLMLTVLFVMIAEVLIFLPSIANFKLRWLEERLGTAAAVSVVLVREDADSLPRTLQDDVLLAIGAKAIAVRDDGVSRLLVIAEMPPEVDEHIDLAHTGPVVALSGALDTLFFGGNRMLRVFGKVGESATEFELIIPDNRLRAAMLVYSRNVALLSLVISLFTATLVYAAIDRIMIRPIRAMTSSMLAFARAPDDPGRIITPEDRSDEIGVAERELADMQKHMQRTLGEQKHLADLGLAVSKINHDMRNILASAQLLSDRLRAVRDPSVQAFAPRLLRTLDRAVSYSEGVLAYGRTQEAPPSRRRLRLRHLVDEVQDLLGVDEAGGIEFVNAVEAGFEVDADSEQLFRVLTNLSRNAIQAMSADDAASIVRRLSISAERIGSVSRILVSDTGPGLPQKARENLFAAFRGSARSGGTGLGLAIAHELVRAHGGSLELIESIGGRTVFSVSIPDQPVRLDEARSGLRRPA